MRRHSADLVGLIFGTAFVIAGVGFLVRETTDSVVDSAWATGLGLMLLGAIALIATVARGPRHKRVADFAHGSANTDLPADTDADVEVPSAATSDE